MSKPIDPLHEDAVLLVEKLEKTFTQGARSLTIFSDLDLKVEAGQCVALVGQSGSGKSTLLHIAGLLDKPTAGEVYIDHKPTSKMKDAQRTRLRNSYIGFIYQFHHLLPEFSALENAAMPLIIMGAKKKYAHNKAHGLLNDLGLGQRIHHRPAQLSGGEQQRVAIARALITEPKLLLADEPTGNLDPETSAEVFEMLMSAVRDRDIAALIATHNIQLAEKMDRRLQLKAGAIESF